jgi:tungstate transport system ATP-binding protein
LADEVVNLFRGRVVQSSLENFFSGTVKRINDISLFDTGKMKIDVVTDREGVFHAAIDPRDIIVSHQPISSSARNSYYGKISAIYDDELSVRLSIDVGEEFKVTITKESFFEMKLSVGSNVYLTFKSTAVEIF